VNITTKKRTRIVAVATVLLASAGLLAFRSADDGADRAPLARYNPAAIEAVGPDVPENNAEVAVVMEVRNVCQQVHGYAAGKAAARDVAASVDDATREALAAGKRFGQTVDITEFSKYAMGQIEASEKSGSLKTVEEFLANECAGVDYSIPVLANA